MSRQPSPGSASGQPTSYYRDAHGLPIEKNIPHFKIVYRAGEQQSTSQGGPTPLPMATSSSSGGRTRSKAYQSGIAAGAEDVKYAAKYRDLKQKVKDIEADNDRLVFKVLQAKRNIQRAKLERAILYERLGALPASPPQANAPLPPQHVIQQQLPPGGPGSRHPEAQPYGQSGRHQRGPPASHHHRQHHQQPIQPAPSHVSPPQHHLQAHLPHPPPRDAAHPGQLPITHAQQVTTIQTPGGPLVVVAGPDGLPVTTADGQVIPAREIHHPPPPSASHTRKRGGRVSKDVREAREREAREIREREEMEGKQVILTNVGAGSGHPPPGGSPPHLEQVQGAPGQVVPISREQRDREREWEIERGIRERERMQRREGNEEERERGVHAHHHTHHHHHHHGHSHRHHQQISERNGSPPPPDIGPSTEPVSSPQAHRSHSQTSHASYRSHHSHGHHIHSHSHSASPLSPGGSSYPAPRFHNHQRVGPGSYVLRDRTDAPPPTEPSVPTPVPSTPLDDASTVTPTPGASASRVPTPPYIQRSRSEIRNSNASPDEEVPGAKSESIHNEEVPIAHGASALSP